MIALPPLYLRPVLKYSCTLLLLLAISYSMNAADKSNMIDPLHTIAQTMPVSAPTVVNTANVFYPDSVIQKDTLGDIQNKSVFQYVGNNKTEECFYVKYGNSSNLILSSKALYGYDAKNRANRIEIYNWRSTNNALEGSQRIEYEFDDLNRCIKKVNYSWDLAAKSWYIDVKTLSIYPGPYALAVDTIYSYNSTTKQLVLSSKSTCNYSTDMSRLTHIQYNFDQTSQVWVAKSKIELQLDKNANDTLKVYSTWDKTLNGFVLTTREHRTYIDSRPTYTLAENWNSANQKWVNNVYSKSVYNDQGNQTILEMYNWDLTNNDWVGISKLTNEYDSTGLYVKLFNAKKWNLATKNWVDNFQFSYRNSAEGRRDSVEIYLYSNNRWQLNIIQRYYYKINQSGVVNPTQQLHTIYPNPTKSDFKITGIENNCSVSVYDLKGKVMISKKINANQSIDVSSLPSGVYIVKGFDAHASFHSKLVVE